MAARSFTVHSLGAGGRFGRPGKPMAPPARNPNAAPTGGEFKYDPNGGMGDFVRTKGELAQNDASIFYPAENIAKVHDGDVIGARTFVAAQAFDKAVDDALKNYMKALRKAYTFQHEGYTYCALDLFTEGERQPIVRRYLAVKLAARDLVETRTDQASIEAPGGTLDFFEGGLSDLTKGDNPFEDGTFSLRSASRATCCCVFFSVTLGVLALVVAGAFYAEGSRLYDGEDAGQPVSHFWDGNFWGWPSEKIFRNIWCGLMLGVVFGFLDNFGLFYGTSALDGSFYSIGNKIASGLLAPTKAGQHVTSNNLKANDKYTTEVAIAAHQITEDMMSGLGNTFSDLLGVALGTAALEIAKAGLGVEPSWWPADLLAIVLGCLLGVFLPVVVKYKDKVAERQAWKWVLAALCMVLIFGSVLVVGIPGDADTRKADFPWTIGVSLGFFVLILSYLLIVVIAMPLSSYRKCAIPQQWAVLQVDDEVRKQGPQRAKSIKTSLRVEAREEAEEAPTRPLLQRS